MTFFDAFLSFVGWTIIVLTVGVMITQRSLGPRTPHLSAITGVYLLVLGVWEIFTSIPGVGVFFIITGLLCLVMAVRESDPKQ